MFPLWTIAGATAVIAFTLSSASAHDDSDTNVYGITSVTDYFYPSGSYDDPYNGVRVYLSSPRHSNSGSRGECMNPGRQENENGRGFNWRAANGNYIGTTYDATSHGRNLHARGYYVAVSPNSKDDGFIANRTASQNWGSDIHIITHTNAGKNCPDTSNYLLTIYEHSNDHTLAEQLGLTLDYYVPGPRSIWQRTDLSELETNATYGDAYVELQFHSNQTTQSWLYSHAHEAAWRYGTAVDIRLAYP